MSSPDAIADLVEPSGCVASIGVFDGVHRGHQSLLAVARSRADELGLPLVAVTFEPHPMAVVGPRVAPPSLASIDRRTELLREHGSDAVRVLAFDEPMSMLTPDEFVADILVGELHAKEIVVGADFRFGHRAAGNVGSLQTLGHRLGFGVTAVPLVGDEVERWSSTYARALVEGGDVDRAGDVLGRDYALDGTVVHGDHRGRELGYPTANLEWVDRPVVPADGVYAGWVQAGPDRWPAAISVGTNPQFAGLDRRVEAYVLDRNDLDLYGHAVGVSFTRRLRGQRTFESVEALIAQMGDDVARARAILHDDA